MKKIDLTETHEWRLSNNVRAARREENFARTIPCFLDSIEGKEEDYLSWIGRRSALIKLPP